MDSEIKRLLHLSTIPGFKLLKKEQEKLDAWKEAQVKIKPKTPRKKRTPKGYTRLEEMGTNADGVLVPTENLKETSDEAKALEKKAKELEKKKTKNIVKADQKEVGEIDEA